MGGLTNSVLRALERVGLADVFGDSRVPLLVLNVVYPLVPEEIRDFCAGKRAVLDRRGRLARLHRAGGQRRTAPRRHPDQGATARAPLPAAGEYSSDVLLEGLAAFLQAAKPQGIDADDRRGKGARSDCAQGQGRSRARRPAAAPADLLHRLPGAAGVLRNQADAARTGPDAYQRRHRLSFLRDLRAVLSWAIPFSATACRSPAPPRSTPNMEKRPIAIMGDGGFWHNGLITGVASNLFNKGDGVLIVMQNGYASATGQQYIPSSTTSRDRRHARRRHRADAAADGRQMAAQGAHLRRRQDGEDAERGDAHRRTGPEGHHRRRRMPARAPAPRARRGRRASSSAASASRAPATASTTKSAPATIPASASPAARR